MVASVSTWTRKHPRRVVNWRTSWGTSPTCDLHGDICNISAGGLFLRPVDHSATAVQAGTRLWVWFSAPGVAMGMKPVSGVVRWMGHNSAFGCEGFGIEFDQLHPWVASDA